MTGYSMTAGAQEQGHLALTSVLLPLVCTHAARIITKICQCLAI